MGLLVDFVENVLDVLDERLVSVLRLSKGLDGVDVGLFDREEGGLLSGKRLITFVLRQLSL